MEELMTPQEFAQQIKAKYPQYKDVDDLELATRIVEKYPQYADKVSFEKKNPNETVTDSKSGDGSSESQGLRPISELYDEDGKFVGMPNEDPSIAQDMWNSLKAGTKEALAGLAGTPQLINKAVFSLIAPKELEEFVNTLEPDQRETFISNMISAGGTGSAAGMAKLGEIGGDVQEELNEEADKIREKMTQYDKTITEDLGDGKFSQAGRRIAVEGVGAIPSVIQAMIPYVGLASVGSGSAAQKQERLEEGGEDFGGQTIVNSVLTGTVEGLLEKYTARQGKALLKSLSGKSKDVVGKGVKGYIEGLKEVGKGALGEGGTEALQSAGENLVDAITTGNEKEAFEIFTEISDSFLVGMAVGAPMRGGKVIADGVNRKRLEDGKEPVEVPAQEEPAQTLDLQQRAAGDYVDNVSGNVIKRVGSKKWEVQDADGNVLNTAKTLKDSYNWLDLQNAENQGVVTPESGVDETGQGVESDTQVTEPTDAGTTTKLRKIGEKSREKAKGEKIPVGKRATNIVNKISEEVIDRQSMAKRIIRKAGIKNTGAFMVAQSGASSFAKNIANRAYDKTVKNLTNAEISRLEEMIFARRVQAIDENRAARGLEPIDHPDGYTSEQAAADLNAYKQELGDAKFNELMQRSDNYFDEYKSLLGTMREEGLISKETYETFAEVNYQPRQFLEMMEDMHGNFLVEELNKAETIPLSQKQIASLKGGSKGQLNMDAFGILEASILTRSRAVFGNRLNNTFAAEFVARQAEINELRNKESLTKEEKKEVKNFELLEENVRMDEIIGYTKKGEPKYKLEGTNTKGWKPIYFYKDGVKHRAYLKDAFHQRYTDTNNQYLNGTVRENIALFSGTSTVKTLATGNNPLFFITNTPRDFLFVLTFSEEYGNEVFSNSIKLARDAIKGWGSVMNNSENYQKFLEYGGGMDFLALQGRMKDKGLFKKAVDEVVNKKTQDKVSKNKIFKAIAAFNTASEVGIRMAVFNKSINNQLKELGVSDINSISKQQRDLIYTKAVKQARQLTDFNQGGKTVKALDAGLPYLNAAVQGTRAAASNIKQRPLETTVRIAQITGYTVGATVLGSMGAIMAFRSDDDDTKDMTNSEIYFETLRGVSEYDLNNYFIIPLGTRDEDGNWNYLRIAKSQSLTPNLNAAEYFVRKALASQGGIEYKQDLGDTMMRTFETNILPLPASGKEIAARVPFFDASMALYGIDSYTGNPLSWDKGEIPEQLEGITDERVQPVYKELGKMLGQSPLRLQSAIESYITTPSTNPYVGILYGVGNMASGGLDKSFTKGLKNLAKNAGKRVFKSTSEYNKVAKAKERSSDAVIDAYRKHIETESIVRNAVKEAKRTGDEQVAIDGLKKAYENQPQLLDKSISWFKSEYNKKRLNPLVSSLRFEEIKEVKAILIADRFGDKLIKDNPDYTDQEKAILRELLDEKVIDDEVIELYKNIFKSKKK